MTGEILQCKVRAGEHEQAGTLPQPLMLLGDVEHLNVRAQMTRKTPGGLSVARRRRARCEVRRRIPTIYGSFALNRT